VDNDVQETLHIITIWDLYDEESKQLIPFAYAVIAKDLNNAKKIGIKKHKAESQRLVPELRVDNELCFEVTCAPNGRGILYDIRLEKQS
jgi:hypothetical protein